MTERREKKEENKPRAAPPKVEFQVHPIGELLRSLAGPPAAEQTPQEVEQRAHQQKIDSRNAKLCQVAECMLHILVSTAPMADRRLDASIAKTAFDIASGFMAEAERRVIQPGDVEKLLEQCRTPKGTDPA